MPAAMLNRGQAITRSMLGTPIGALCAFTADDCVIAIEFEDQGRAARILERQLGGVTIQSGRMPDRLREALEAYFATGTCEFFYGIRLQPIGTQFQRSVWARLLEVPPGQLISYGAVADAVGVPGGARAVGAANGQNPIPILIPCHRVVGSRGELTGYGSGLGRKEWLIRHERASLGLDREAQAEFPFVRPQP